MKRMLIAAAVLTLAAAPLTTFYGCGKSDDEAPAAMEQTSNQLATIREKANGDWNKLSPDEQKFLKDLSGGSEQSAKMLLFNPGSSGGGVGRPGGPPGRTGAPPGPGANPGR